MDVGFEQDWASGFGPCLGGNFSRYWAGVIDQDPENREHLNQAPETVLLLQLDGGLSIPPPSLSA